MIITLTNFWTEFEGDGDEDGNGNGKGNSDGEGEGNGNDNGDSDDNGNGIGEGNGAAIDGDSDVCAIPDADGHDVTAGNKGKVFRKEKRKEFSETDLSIPPCTNVLLLNIFDPQLIWWRSFHIPF